MTPTTTESATATISAKGATTPMMTIATGFRTSAMPVHKTRTTSTMTTMESAIPTMSVLATTTPKTGTATTM